MQIGAIVVAVYVVVLVGILYRVSKSRSNTKKISGRGGDFN